jgi:LmbE family N-acetylglucosaminyl deacetylase
VVQRVPVENGIRIQQRRPVMKSGKRSSEVSVPLFATMGTLLVLLAFAPARVQSQAPARVDDGKLRIIVFGAHPDDCELKAGGTAALWAAQGHHVKFVSVTNGDIGHAEMSGGALAKRRTAEVREADRVLGVESEVLDIHDGELMPTLENRKKLVRLIREWNADIVMGHRPNDYHPDHRYTGVLMQDAAYMVTVKFFCPDVPQMAKNPVFLYVSDGFQKPNPFQPDIVVATDSVMEKKQAAIWKLESQIESLWATGNFEKVVPIPTDPAGREQRRRQQAERTAGRDRGVADRFRAKLIELYGPEKGQAVKYAEAFEICEYGRRPSSEELKKLFPIAEQK